MNKSSVKCILNTIHFIRLQRLCNKKGKYQELELDLNYLHVAQAAQNCSAYFSALMYAEKWYQSRMNTLGANEKKQNITHVNILAENVEDVTALRSILIQAYNGIGDTDATHGEHLEDIENLDSLRTEMADNHNFDLLLLQRDIELNSSTENGILMANSLKHCALYNLAVKVCMEASSYGDTYYECMWRLGKWNLPVSTQKSEGFETHVYNILNAINDDDKTSVESLIQTARLQVANSLRCETSLESCKTLYGSLSELERLQELEDIFNIVKNDGNLQDLMIKFIPKDDIQTEFKYFESRIAQRIEVLGILEKRNYKDAHNIYVDMRLKLADASRKQGNLHISERILSSLASISNEEIKAQVTLMEAQIHWKLGHCRGVLILKNLLNKYNKETRLRSTILKVYGEWMAETQAEFPPKILTAYFLPSIDILNLLNASDKGHFEMLHETYNILATFADKEYQHINNSIKSPEFQHKVQAMEKLKASARKLRSIRNQTEDIKRAALTSERFTNLDEIDIKNKYSEKDTFLNVAMKYYLYNMKYNKNVQIQIFRIFSLWLENKSNDTLIAEIEENLLSVESYKILTILPQLVPHISIEDDRFGKCISNLIERCAFDHPHHAVPLILSVANTNEDDIYSKENANTSSNESRISGAKKMINKLRKSDKLKNIIDENQRISSGIIELAYYKNPRMQGGKIPRNLKIYSIRNFTQALLPTCNLSIQVNLNYSNIVGIHRFKSEYSMVGGLNAPKRIECFGTDGISRFQLVKGKDDLRQDAVMQQVFSLMNGLLRDSKETINLHIRTYKVVPLSKRSGLLEWVNNSMPIGQFLMDAHTHYHPKDITPHQAKNEIKRVASDTNSQRLHTYSDICARMKPAFHKFFENNFLQSTVWYEKRRSYTQSVATSSMCGYILGIGDRHVQNILIDLTTAEVIHIDFGIAFEQGSILPTPETVPFRLTRDIVDGMGICGVEGTFRRTCEKTMEALRRNGITIQTILEVLLYDPLYAWSITPTQAYSKQMDEDSRDESQLFSDEDEMHINVTAERALHRLKQKLQGNDSGNNTSIETQVDRLIQQAKEPSNLSKLFYGWQAYL